MPVDCPTCGASLAPVPAAGDEVAVGTVAGAVEQRPRWRCAQGHDNGPVLTAERVRAEVDEQVRVGRARRLRRLDRCCACEAELTMPVRRTVWPVTLTDPDRRVAVTLTYDVPATRCPACATNQVPSRSTDDVIAVADGLFKEPDEP